MTGDWSERLKPGGSVEARVAAALEALRAIGQRKSSALKAAALDLAQRLAAYPDPAQRWVGKDAVRDLTKQKKTGEDTP